MSLGFPDAPVAKGRKSLTTWLNVLPTGPPLNAEPEQESQPSHSNNILEDRAIQGVTTQVTRVPERLQYDFLQPQAQIHAPRPRTPFGRPRTPLDRSHTPVNRTLTPFDLRTPSSRPQIPQSQVSLGKQRPANIVVPSQSQACKGILAYNPAEPRQNLDSSPPIPHGRRSIPVQHPSNYDRPPSRLGYSAVRPTAPLAPIARGSRIPSRDSTYMSIPKCERGLLIIGSSHRDPSPYASEFPPLLGIQNDRDRLRTAFQNRKYSVETMVEEEGNKNEILRRVGNFLASAEGGDIRMIVFTGHAARIGNDQRFAIIPWGCSSEDDTITSAEWQRVILENAASGVVVVSVFATCMSGAAMEQSERLTNFDRIIEKQSLVTVLPNGPIQIILSSSGDAQSSFEYHTPSRHSGSTTWHDYFLWALAETTQRVDVDSWESFVKTLQTTFNYVRAAGFRNSSFQYPQDLEWLLNHPQTPHIFVSSQMPDFDRFLPPPGH